MSGMTPMRAVREGLSHLKPGWHDPMTDTPFRVNITPRGVEYEAPAAEAVRAGDMLVFEVSILGEGRLSLYEPDRHSVPHCVATHDARKGEIVRGVSRGSGVMRVQQWGSDR